MLGVALAHCMLVEQLNFSSMVRRLNFERFLIQRRWIRFQSPFRASRKDAIINLEFLCILVGVIDFQLDCLRNVLQGSTLQS